MATTLLVLLVYFGGCFAAEHLAARDFDHGRVVVRRAWMILACACLWPVTLVPLWLIERRYSA